MNEKERAEHGVRSLRRWVDQAHWYASVAGASDLSELDERERESFPFEWDDVVDRSRKLVGWADAGLLGRDDLNKLRGIVDELTELLPTMQRLRLRTPDVEALARAAGRVPADQPPLPQR
jgi:hypothetical protein